MTDVLAETLDGIARRIRKLERQIIENADQTRQQRAAIKGDETIIAGAKKQKLEALRLDGEQKFRKLTAEIDKLLTRHEREQTKLRRLPVDDAKQAHARRLLREDGLAANEILDRAVENGDMEMIDAVRAELEYHGDKKNGFADTRAALEGCDRAAAKLGGHQGERYAANLRANAAKDEVEQVAQYAAKVHMGADTPHDTLTFAFATGAGKQDSDA
jgi:hypothetical protein